MIEVHKSKTAVLILALACAGGMVSCQLGFVDGMDSSAGAMAATATRQDGPSLIIENDSPLPDTSPHVPYEVRFRAHGGVGAQHWRIEKGAIPPGMKFEDDGLLHGQAERSGEFEFTVAVTDARQQSGVQKVFTLRVRSGLSLDWKKGARVSGNRIDGSVEVLNATPDDMDLTFYVLAVAENGRATAIGYQRFVLRSGAPAKELPFGETLPHGGYVVHVDAVGEVAAKHLIYRENLQTPGALQVTVGP
ncbi:MAG TPA: putative Ig domain-containing protein [Candidatus Sulfotelmatobacter sp.]|jgi:hypothetical protein